MINKGLRIGIAIAMIAVLLIINSVQIVCVNYTNRRNDDKKEAVTDISSTTQDHSISDALNENTTIDVASTTESPEANIVDENQDVTVYLPVKATTVAWSENEPDCINNMEYDEHGYLKKCSWEAQDYQEFQFTYDDAHQLNACTCAQTMRGSVKFVYENGEITKAVAENADGMNSCDMKDGKIVDIKSKDYEFNESYESEYVEKQTSSGYEINGATVEENEGTFCSTKLSYSRENEGTYKIKGSRKYSDSNTKFSLHSEPVEEDEILISYDRTSDDDSDLFASYGVSFEQNNIIYIYGGYDGAEHMSFWYNYENDLLSSAYIGDGKLYFERDAHGNITRLNDHVIEYKEFTIPADEWDYYRDHYYYLYRSFAYCGINALLSHEVAIDEGYGKNLINDYTPYIFIEEQKRVSGYGGIDYSIQLLMEKIAFFSSLDTKSIYENHQRVLSVAGY